MDLFEKAKDSLLGKEKPQSESEQSLEDRKLVQFVNSKLEDSRSNANRIAQEGIWLTNVSYLCGVSGVYYDTGSKNYRPVDYVGSMLRSNRISFNKILPLVNNRQARLCKNAPRWDVIPRSMDQDDKDAAVLSLDAVKDVWDREKINQKRLEMVMAKQTAGHAYFKVCWDMSKGPASTIETDEGNEDVVNLGDVSVEYVSAFEVYPDPLAKNWDELQYLTHAKIRPLSYFKRYPNGHLVKEEGNNVSGLQYESRINGFTNQSGVAGGMVEMKNSAIEKSYYEAPNDKNKKGRHIIIANGILLKSGDLPIGEIPFVKFNDIKIPDKFYSEAVVTQLRPLQDQQDRILAMRAMWANRLLAGKYIAARGHGLLLESLNDESGEIVEFDPVPGANEPHALDMPVIPQYAYQEDDTIDRKMGDFAGIGETTSGQMPSASIPAIGMQFLVEQDETRLGVVTEDDEHNYARLGSIILQFIEAYYDDERDLVTTGKNRDYSIRKFTGKDLKGHTQVRVVRGSTAPGSKVLERQEILNLYDRGLLGNPQDPNVASATLEKLQFGDSQDVWTDDSIDKKQISRHIKLIEKEKTPPVHEGDNHALFYRELNRYRKTEKYDRLSELSKSILLECMEKHLQEITNITAPNVGDEPDNPDLMESSMGETIAAEKGIDPGEAMAMAETGMEGI